MIFIYLGSIYVLNNGKGWDWLATTITGPNDARCVVWAKGIFFFFHSCFLLLTNFIIGSTYQVTTDKGGNEGIRLKRRKTCHLGQRCVFFRVFYNLITLFRDFFSYGAPPTHSSTTTTPPSLETQVGGVFFLSSAPPSLKTWDGGAFCSSSYIHLLPLPLSTTITKNGPEQRVVRAHSTYFMSFVIICY